MVTSVSSSSPTPVPPHKLEATKKKPAAPDMWETMAQSQNESFKGNLAKMDAILKDIHGLHEEVNTKEAQLKVLDRESGSLSSEIKAAHHHPVGAFAKMAFNAVFHGGKFETIVGMETKLAHVMEKIATTTGQMGQLEAYIGENFKAIAKLEKKSSPVSHPNAPQTKPNANNVWTILAKSKSDAHKGALKQYETLLKEIKTEQTHLMSLYKRVVVLKQQAEVLGKDLAHDAHGAKSILSYYGHEIAGLFKGHSFTSLGSMETKEAGLLNEIDGLMFQISTTEQSITDHLEAISKLAHEITGPSKKSK